MVVPRADIEYYYRHVNCDLVFFFSVTFSTTTNLRQVNGDGKTNKGAVVMTKMTQNK